VFIVMLSAATKSFCSADSLGTRVTSRRPVTDARPMVEVAVSRLATARSISYPF